MFIALGVIVGTLVLLSIGFLIWIGYEQERIMAEREEETSGPKFPLSGKELKAKGAHDNQDSGQRSEVRRRAVEAPQARFMQS